jgi:hypothetical protein
MGMGANANATSAARLQRVDEEASSFHDRSRDRQTADATSRASRRYSSGKAGERWFGKRAVRTSVAEID